MQITGVMMTVAALLVALTATTVSGQALWPLSVEASLGLGVGRTPAEYRDNNFGVSADAMVALRVRRLAAGAAVVATGFGVQSGGPVADICILNGDGGCVPAWPRFDILSVLGGWETSGGRVRAMAGPAAVRIDFDAVQLALLARTDAAIPLFARVALMGSVRVVFIDSYNGASFQLFSLGAGFRMR
jgi:hypothetical protein